MGSNNANGNGMKIQVAFAHPRGGSQFRAEITNETTAEQAIVGLVEARFIEPAAADRSYALALQRTEKQIPPTGSIVGHGAVNGDVLLVTETSAGAASLSYAEQLNRKAFDHSVIRGMKSPLLGAIVPYASTDDLRRGKQLLEADAAAGRAGVYVVTYNLRVRSSQAIWMDRSKATFHLDAGGNYPFSTPAVQFSRPIPWSPHIAMGSGVVCLGDGWTHARGRMLAAGLIIHVLRLLNEDEQGSEHGLNGAAFRVWEKNGRNPIHPNLDYPVLPAELTHGVRAETRQHASPFRELGMATAAPATFRPLGAS